jgi:Tfp pilus assembly protein FimT
MTRPLHRRRRAWAQPSSRLLARHDRGRSLLEIVIVIAVTVCLAAIALPNVLMAYDQLRLNAAAMEFSGMIQRTRSTAVVQNAPAALRLVSSSTYCPKGPTLWIDANANGTMDANEYARYCVSSHISIATASTTVPASISDALLGDITSVTVSVAGLATPVYFNARGLPCQYNSTNGTCSATISSGSTASSWVYYLYDSPAVGATNWAAVTITPAGRVKVWTWNGSAWK